MTDTAPNVTIDIEQLAKVAKDIAQLDEKISAASGSEAAMRKSVFASVAAENSATVDSVVKAIIAEMAKLEPPVLVGLRERLPDAMDDEFDGQINEIVDAQVEELAKSVKGNIEPIKEERRTKLELFKAVKAILNQFDVDTSSVPDPKRGGGRTPGSGTSSDSVTRTGKNKENYRYHMDGERRPKSQNTLSSLAYYATLGCAGTEDAPERWGTAQLKNFLVEQGVKWGAPGEGQDEWEVTLPNKKVIAARRLDSEKDQDIFAAVAAAEQDKKDEDSGSDEEGSEEQAEESVNQ